MATRKNLANGKPNPRYVDLLDEDPAIAGQKFCCVSFVSPDKIIQRREEFFFSEFVKGWDFEKSVKHMTDFLNFLAFKHNMKFDKLMEDFQDYLKNEQDSLRRSYASVKDDYDQFVENNEDRLEADFNKANNFQTSTRGIKIRGSYGTVQEAQLRAKLLRERDPNHDIYVGQVGVWMPWEPNAYKTGKVEYLEEELNQLMVEKKKNEQQAKNEFEERVKATKRKAIEENIKKARESGNKLTQSIDESGELVGMTGSSTVETAISENVLGGNGEAVSGADIRAELFDTTDVRTKETDKQYIEQLETRFGENTAEDVSGNTVA